MYVSYQRSKASGSELKSFRFEFVRLRSDPYRSASSVSQVLPVQCQRSSRLLSEFEYFSIERTTDYFFRITKMSEQETSKASKLRVSPRSTKEKFIQKKEKADERGGRMFSSALFPRKRRWKFAWQRENNAETGGENSKSNEMRSPR